jgi:hypothetical protein
VTSIGVTLVAAMACSKNWRAAAVSRRGDEDVDDLPELVDRPADIAPPPATFT